MSVEAAAHGAVARHVPPIGFSSGTLPSAGAGELAAAVLAAGGSGLDLRIGRGHRWESDGVRAGLEAIAAAGAEVFFTGVGWRLGDPAGWPVRDAGKDLPPRDYPVKVFCVAEPDPVLVTEQLAAAAGAGLEPWVETHAGGPDAARLLALAERTGVGVLVDLLGLAQIGGASPAQLRTLAPFVRAAQVKGVLRTEHGLRHRPLVPDDLADVVSLLKAATLRAVTVESRAGTPDADLAVLAQVLDTATHRPACTAPCPTGATTRAGPPPRHGSR